MAATNDTIDGLLAEFRGYSAGMPASYHVTMSWADFRVMLDRFEAAHRREVDEAERRANHAAMKNVSETLAKVGPLYDAESIGNAAKLREALEKIAHYADNRDAMDDPDCAYGHILADIAKTALAAPPRNCDVLSAQEQTEKFNQFCQSHRNSDLPKCAGCPLEDIPDGTGCAQAWAQMPYEEGGAK